MRTKRKNIAALRAIVKIKHSDENDNWVFKITHRSFVLSNFFECHDNNGVHEGDANFLIIIPLNSTNPLKDFKLKFWQEDQYLARKFMLRQYLTDTIISILTNK
jgi:hypothetical protein